MMEIIEWMYDKTDFLSILTLMIVITIILCGFEYIYGWFGNHGIDLFWPCHLYQLYKLQYEQIPTNDSDFIDVEQGSSN